MQAVIKSLVENHGKKNREMYGWYKKFRTDVVPIFNRVLPTAQKVNRKINHDYVSLLINTKVNHFLGSPVSVMQSQENEAITELLNRFKRYTAFNRVLSELGKQSALYGYGCVLTYIDTRGEFDFLEVEPYNCYFGEDVAIRELATDIRDFRRFEVYDSTSRYIYEGKDLANLQLVDKRLHLFELIPLFKVKNNKEELNEFYRVRHIIDNLDRLYSDLSSEVEQFRLAYLKFINANIEAEEVLKMIQTGALNLPENSDVDFITKKMQIESVLELIKKEEKNLFKFAMSYDPTENDHAGQLTNLGIFFRMGLINNNCKSTIHYFTEGLYMLFELYSQYLAKKGISLDPYSLDFQFTLETPRNIKEEAEVQQILSGLVSDETRLKLASFVENPAEEKGRLEAELKLAGDPYGDING